MKISRKFSYVILFCIALPISAMASGPNFNDTTQQALAPNAAGNVGIGSSNPGQTLDVNGTVRMIGFTLTGNGANNGYVLVGNSVGIGTWMSATTLPGAGGGSSGWTATGNNVYETLGGNVGIGTTLLTTAALTVMNGNVGIGTWKPAAILDVEGTLSIVEFGGNVGIGSLTPGAALDVNGVVRSTVPGNSYFLGNLGVGSTNPGTALDVTGISRMTGFTLTGNGANNGYVMVSNSVGIGTWMPASTLPVSGAGSSGWTSTGNDVYETDNGNVGIGTTKVTTAALTVMNGNVGIGTWVPLASFTVNGTSILGYVAHSTDSITTLDVGSLAGGFAGDTGSNSGIISALNQGSLAFGYAQGGGGGNGTITSSGSGSIALGYASSGETLQASGTASVAIGNGVQATAGDAIVLGAGLVNSIGNSLMVGFSAGNPVLMVANSNVGINTTLSANSLDVATNVAIGAAYAGYIAAPSNGLIVQGNVGIGSAHPGQMLDVQGTVRSTGLTMSGHSPIAGYVLTASDSAGDTTWSSSGGVGGWTVSGSNVYQTFNGNVGIGTNLLTTAALTVMNGNVGIGTWVPADIFQIGKFKSNSSGFEIDSNGNVGIGTTITSNASLSIMNGNLGIGTWVPAAAIEVGPYGLSAGPPTQIYFANASNTNGYPQFMGQWNSVGAWGIGPATIAGDSNLEIGPTTDTPGQTWGGGGGVNLVIPNGNIGIGTLATATSALTVMSGNVGIGTWVPGLMLDVKGTIRSTGFTMSGQSPISGYVLTASDSAGDTIWSSAGGVAGWTVTGNNVYETDNGNVGIGTTKITTAALTVMNGNVGIGTWIPRAQLDVEGTLSVASFGGNVGIGTWLPAGYFTVENPSYIPNELLINDGTTGLPDTYTGGYVPSLVVNAAEAGGARLSWFGYKNGSNWDSYMTVGDCGSYSQLCVDLGYGATINSAIVSNGNNLAIGGASNIGFSTVDGNAVNVYFGNTGNIIMPNSNVGIGTGSNINGKLVVWGGNVGIGSTAPGQLVDVQGTVRAVGLTMSGQSPIAGYVLTASDSAGDTIWSSAGGVAGWTVTGNNVYETDNGNVGIGTTKLTTAALTVMNGNVGIGTWVPRGTLDVEGTLSSAVFGGNVGIGTINPIDPLVVIGSGGTADTMILENTNNTQSTTIDFEDNTGVQQAYMGYLNSGGGYYPGTMAMGSLSRDLIFDTSGTTTAPKMIIKSAGNVGIGSITPVQELDVLGTVRATGFAMTGQSPIAGYVMTASDSAGDTTWSSAGGVAGWTVTGNNVYETDNGNVGIGTTKVTTAALTVMNGNVGIGTWVPRGTLDVEGTLSSAIFGGNVGIGTFSSGIYNLTVMGNVAGAGLVQYQNMNTAGYDAFNANDNTGLLQMSFGHGNSGTGAYANINYIDSWSTTPLVFHMNGPELVRFTDNGVGIGSTAPGQSLDVQGTVRVLGGGEVGIGTSFLGGAGEAALTVMNGNVGIGTWLPTALFQVNNTNVVNNAEFVVNSAGNVGIGTWLPGDALEIEHGNVGIGTTLLTGASGALDVMGGNVGIGTWVPTVPLSFAPVVGGKILLYPTDSLNNTDGYGFAVQSGLLQIYADNTKRVGVGTISSGTFTEMMSVVGGNVGIGSLTPGQALDVNGTARITGFTLTGNGAGSGFLMVSNNIGVGTWMSVSTLPAASIAASSTNDVAFYNNNVSTLSGGNGFETNGTNVGIGTSGFSNASLEVVGNIGIGTFGYDPFIRTAAPNGGMIISGNVGIGTWVPAYALDVNGGARFTYGGQTLILNPITSQAAFSYLATFNDGIAVNTISENGGNTHIQIGTVGENIGIQTSSPGSLLSVLGGESLGSYATNAAPAGGIIASGNVGIGTWVPAYNLDLVNDTARERVVRRVNTVASSATPAIDTDTTDLFTITALAANITSFTTNLTGTPNNGDLLEIRILDNGTARTIAWGASFTSTTTTLPLTTVVSTTLRILLEYNSASAKWECIGVT